MSRRIALYMFILGASVASLVTIIATRAGWPGVFPLALLGIPAGWAAACLYGIWQKWRAENFTDRVVKELLEHRHRFTPPKPEMSQEMITAQVEIERRLRDAEPVIVRSKLRFIDRPTQEDIQAAVEDDALILVRVPIPACWREKLDPFEVHCRIVRRCNAILQELGLTGGHPRVMLMADTCDSQAMFTEKVYERFGA